MGVVDRLVAGVHHGHFRADVIWFTVHFKLRVTFAVRAGQYLEGRIGFVLLGYEYLRGLSAPALLGFPLTFAEGFPEFARLEFEDPCLSGVGRDLVFDSGVLVGELLALQLKLAGLDLEQFGLLLRKFFLVLDLAFDGSDFLRLLAEREEREDGGDDREHGKDRSAAAVSWVAKMSDMGEGSGAGCRLGGCSATGPWPIFRTGPSGAADGPLPPRGQA